jgi:hypothetical protein
VAQDGADGWGYGSCGGHGPGVRREGARCPFEVSPVRRLFAPKSRLGRARR